MMKMQDFEFDYAEKTLENAKISFFFRNCE